MLTIDLRRHSPAVQRPQARIFDLALAIKVIGEEVAPETLLFVGYANSGREEFSEVGEERGSELVIFAELRPSPPLPNRACTPTA